MTTSITRRSTTFLVVLALTAALLTATVSTAPSADALSITCGQGVIGVGRDYVAGLANGHPATDLKDQDGWGGGEPVRRLGAASLAFDRVKGGLELAYNFADRGLKEDVAQKGLKVGLGIAVTVSGVIIDSLDSAALSLQQRNARVDACSATLLADFVDVLFVTQMEEELANLDLAGATTDDGTRIARSFLVPSGMHVLPNDGWPAWQSDSTLYPDLPGHADLGMPYVDGALNSPFIGVAVTVRNQIAYLEAAGIDIGEGDTTVNPFTGEPEPVPGPKQMWQDALDLLAEGDERGAYVGFAAAYQRAVNASPPPGTPTTSGSDGTSNPWG